ncbi:MAG: serine/threonine-protein kinase [Cyanobacteria bacterium J06621_8]
MNHDYQTNDVISQKYRITKLLGEGGVGKTYEAEDITTSQKVAIKIVSFRQAKDWKVLELFEREAKTLAALEHPSIPKYIDYFHLDTDEDRCFYLVRELVTGHSLFDLVQQGWQATEDEVKQIAIQILEILQYLHEQTPPIIHRDIKSQNLIRDDEGKLFLVDFGSVQEVYRQTLSGNSTFVGTLGYMPPEQLRGQVSFASDLYSLGATLTFLLTKKSLDQLPQKRMKIDFCSQAKISNQLANWLERILEPVAEDRFQSADEALKILISNNQLCQLTNKKRIILNTTSNGLEIKIFHSGIEGRRWSLNNIFAGFVYLSSIIFLWLVVYILSLSLIEGKPWFMAVPIPLLSIPAWILTLIILGQYVFENFGSTYLEISNKKFKIYKYIFGIQLSNSIEARKIEKVEEKSIDSESNGYNLVYLSSNGRKKRMHFGTGIREDEKKLLSIVIKDFLATH